MQDETQEERIRNHLGKPSRQNPEAAQELLKTQTASYSDPQQHYNSLQQVIPSDKMLSHEETSIHTRYINLDTGNHSV